MGNYKAKGIAVRDRIPFTEAEEHAMAALIERVDLLKELAQQGHEEATRLLPTITVLRDLHIHRFQLTCSFMGLIFYRGEPIPAFSEDVMDFQDRVALGPFSLN